MINKKIFFLGCVLLLSAKITAQVSNKLREFINNSSFQTCGVQYPKQVKEFYNYNGFHYYWLTNAGSSNIKLLSNFIQYSPQVGLNKENYQPALLKIYSNVFYHPGSEQDSLLAEVKFTDAAIHLIHDVLMGNKAEPLSYNGLNYTPSCNDVTSILNSYINAGRFKYLMNDIESRDPEYLSVKHKLNFYQQIISGKNFKDAVVKSSKEMDKPALVKRLYQLGFTDSDTAILSKAVLVSKVKEAQNLFGLANDGIFGSATLRALNIPLDKRVAELKYTLNAIRWLTCIKQTRRIIVVNIPSANLLLYERGKIVLESKIIVGKESNPTPTLSSKITEVILYPYWNVPNNIATQELLPKIKRDPDYLDENNYQVLNKQARVMNPYEINWQALSRNYFPYVLRQSTGCDNSLGLIKLNFYNPFTVYLHDTPAKSLFDQNQRYFSHGCMRLQKAVEVAHYILRDNTIAIDTLTEKGCLKNQSPIIVPATEIIPVFVLYHTAWIDSAARVKFYRDVYNKFSALK